jgi:hypothetical protein
VEGVKLPPNTRTSSPGGCAGFMHVNLIPSTASRTAPGAAGRPLPRRSSALEKNHISASIAGRWARTSRGVWPAPAAGDPGGGISGPT